MLKAIATLMLSMCSGAIMAAEIEEPCFDLLDQFGAVEIRHYEPGIQAQTTLDSDAATTSGFRRLAGYIFGGNDQGMEIAMTAPVQETLDDPRPIMAFTMPSAYSMEELPRPNAADVTLREIPGKTVAVIRFSGWATTSRVEHKTAQLLAELERRDIEVGGGLSLNQYNPPWTLPFLRRNEVMVEIRGPASTYRDASGGSASTTVPTPAPGRLTAGKNSSHFDHLHGDDHDSVQSGKVE